MAHFPVHSLFRQFCGFLRVLRFPPPIKLTAMIQDSHYFQIRGISNFSFREPTGKIGRQHGELREVGDFWEKLRVINRNTETLFLGFLDEQK